MSWQDLNLAQVMEQVSRRNFQMLLNIPRSKVLYTWNIYLCIWLQGLGGGWIPVRLTDQEELNFIRVAQRGLSDDRSYWIGGSTASARRTIIDYTTQYNTSVYAGNLIAIFLCWNTWCFRAFLKFVIFCQVLETLTFQPLIGTTNQSPSWL